MDSSTNIDPFITRTLAGVTIHFGKLTPRDRAGVLRRLKAERKAALIANLRSAGIDREQILIELESFDDAAWGQSRWLDHLNTIEGQEEVVLLAWGKQNSGDPTSVIDAIESADGGLLPLAAALCNLRLVPATPETGKEQGDDPAPFVPEPAD